MPETSATSAPFSRAWYGAPIADFLVVPPTNIIGELTTHSDFPIDTTQRDAWLTEIRLLQTHLTGLTGSILLEFSIPRMGRRIDAVLLTGPIVFVLEFKVGEKKFDRAAIDQVWDYALDLKNFHEASHAASIVPVLIATDATESARRGPSARRGSPDPAVATTAGLLHPDADQVYRPLRVRPQDLRPVIDLALRTVPGQSLNEQAWPIAPYHPTPTIIEAARALYAQHSVEAIARHDASARNLRVTSRRIEEIVDEARASKRKVICFVTGVPGAGKTLVGLNIATRRRDKGQPTHAVFLSGNGPLVAVLREALTRDEVERESKHGNSVRKGEVRERVKAFIQNVHHFRDEGLIDSRPPSEHVVIFDEAQRAWNMEQTASFMKRKKKRPGFTQSEPEFLISYMDRLPEWAVIVCLVGGGQEIHTGEAGIDAWIHAVNSKFPHWHMVISSRLTDSEYAAGGALDAIRRGQHSDFDDSLHLSVSMRSFRAENVSHFVKSLLDRDNAAAQKTLGELRRYPIAVTRDLRIAKQWLRDHARGSERYGLVASSKAQRLKPDAIDIRVHVDPVHWFLDGKEDTRSSYYLEDAATEFQVQGLELDWACVAWDGDLRYTEDGWTHHSFRGDRWCNIKREENRRYLLNAYRVLLTRARQGMVVYLPPGDSNDRTRSQAFYDQTGRFLNSLGISEF